VAAQIESEVAGFRAEIGRQEKRLDTLQNEREKVLRAHYADAIPLDMMKREMQRIDREAADAEQRLSACQQPYDQILTHLENLEHFIESVATIYRHGDDRTRRQVNQALFQKLLVTEDGVVDIEPARLLDGVVRLPTVARAETAPGPTASATTDTADGRDSKNPGPLVRGSNLLNVVRPLGFEPRTCGLRVRCSAIELEALGCCNLPPPQRCERRWPPALSGRPPSFVGWPRGLEPPTSRATTWRSNRAELRPPWE
jgi:hypothetical protein